MGKTSVTIGAVGVGTAVVIFAGNQADSDALAAIVITGAVALVALVVGLVALVCYRVKRHVLTTWPEPGIARTCRAEVMATRPADGPERPRATVRPVVRGEVLAAPERPGAAPLALRSGRD
jgi:hypothetical protein